MVNFFSFGVPFFISLKVLGKYISPYRWLVVLGFLSLSLSGVITLLMGASLRHLVDEGFAQENPHIMDKAMLILLLYSIVLAICASIRSFTTTWLSEQVSADLRKDLFDHILSFDQIYLESAKIGELLARLETDMVTVRSVMAVSGAVVLRSLIQFFGSVGLLLMTSLKLTAIAFLVVPLSLTPLIILGHRVRALNKKRQQSENTVSAFVHEILVSLKSVQAFCQEKSTFHKYLKLVRNVLENGHARAQIRAITMGLVIAVIFSSVVLILWLGARDVFAGKMTFGDLSAFVFYTAVAAGSLNSLSEMSGDLSSLSGALERIIALRDVKPSIQDNRRSRKGKEPFSLTLPLTIEFHQVTFAYPSRPRTPTLKEASFVFEFGKTYAIVGSSGAGKSTIFHLLQRFYDPQQGFIAINGHDMRTLPLETIRRMMALVPQEPHIFSGTLWENIAFGSVKATHDEILQAAHLSYVSEFAEHLPQKFDTLLGEQGIRLSGGQKQRLALARAILYNAPFLLLDEATNALDSKSAYHVQKALEESFKNRTRLVIAHSLSTVLNADQILVLGDGKIVEQGTHKELLALDGSYSRLAEHQFTTLMRDSTGSRS